MVSPKDSKEDKVFDFVMLGRLLEKPFELRIFYTQARLLGTIILGNSLDTIRNGMLGQLSGKDKSDGSLNLFAANGGSLVVGSNLASLAGSTFKDIINKAVHDGHGLLGDVHIGMALAQNLENVGRVGFVTGATTLSGSTRGLLDGGFGGSFTGRLLFSFGGHG